MAKYIIQKEWDTIKKKSRYYGYSVLSDQSKFCIVIEDSAIEAENQLRLYHESQSKPEIVKELEL